ncbi:MAG: hypothetical protein CVV27_14665 [Candidatus Melainabacteria bacterium HGW-Melainabacteria-1]|nr:MAG: hypothetical protein CVV27_14665 [Candidatus Melainabacteria bacterium HGW-Melainabacteria-1]
MSEIPTEALSDTLREHISGLSASPSLAEALHLFLEGQPASAGDQEPWEIFIPWLSGHDPAALAELLTGLKDGMPVPQPVGWQDTPDWDRQLASADRRTVKVFRELLRQQRKSSAYYRDLTHVFERHPHQPRLAQLLLSYLLRWEGPESAAHFASHQLERHPDWHLLRFAWANQVMYRTQLRKPEAEQLARLLDILQHKLLLEQHLAAEQTPEADSALLFYQATGFYYLLTRQLERAVFSINQAAAIDSDNPLLVILLMAATAIIVEDLERAHHLRDFLRPLMANK